MAYTLEEFCTDCRGAIQAGGEGKVEAVRLNLEKLLHDEAFVAAQCGPDAEAGIRTIYVDEETDFNVLVHIYEKGKTEPPHDHGTSWGVYGQATLYTDMKVWNRTDSGNGVGQADLEVAQEFRLELGQARKVEVGEIHSIEFPDDARFVRVTGTDLDAIPTLRFDPEKQTASVGSRLQPLKG